MRVAEVLNARVMRRQEGLVDDPERQVELLTGIAEVLEGQLNDPVQAIGAYRQALSVDSTNGDVLNALERLYRINP